MANGDDPVGVWLENDRDAWAELRARTRRAIAAGDAQGLDVRTIRVRLRDESGRVLFEGTIAEAAQATDGERGAADGLGPGPAKTTDGPS